MIIHPCKQWQARRSPLAPAHGRAARLASPCARQGRESNPAGWEGLSSLICLFLTSKTKLFPFCPYFLCWFSLESGLVLILVPGACLPGKLQRGKLSLERFQACAFVAEGLETSHSCSVVLQGDLQPEQHRAGCYSHYLEGKPRAALRLLYLTRFQSLPTALQVLFAFSPSGTRHLYSKMSPSKMERAWNRLLNPSGSTRAAMLSSCLPGRAVPLGSQTKDSGVGGKQGWEGKSLQIIRHLAWEEPSESGEQG